MVVKLDDLDIHYSVTGKGEPIVLLHGWGGSGASFNPLVQILSVSYCVYSVDFPGFGNSSEPKVPWGTEEYALIIEKFLTMLNIKKFVIIGHSFGGRVAIRFASKNYADLLGVILVDSPGIKTKKNLKQLLKEKLYKFLKRTLIYFIKGSKQTLLIEKLSNRFGSVDYKNTTGIMRRTMVKVVNEDLTYLLPQMSSSTLLVWGENDEAVPLKVGEEMFSLIPKSKLIVIKNAGHFPYLDNLPYFASEVKIFLRKVFNEND